MQSRCNDTCVSGGYEIVRSVTAEEVFAGTWEKRRYCSFEQVSVAPSTPRTEKGCVASKLSNTVFGLKQLSPSL